MNLEIISSALQLQKIIPQVLMPPWMYVWIALGFVPRSGL